MLKFLNIHSGPYFSDHCAIICYLSIDKTKQEIKSKTFRRWQSLDPETLITMINPTTIDDNNLENYITELDLRLGEGIRSTYSTHYEEHKNKGELLVQ